MNPYNTEPRIRLVDKVNCLIKMVSQIQAFHLLRHGFCELLMVKPPTIQFQLDEWNDQLLKMKKSGFLVKNDGMAHWLKARKSVLYGNFHIQSPDGHVMFHCNNQKALWYLNRDIADIVGDDPPTLRFKFVPGGPGHIGDSYYLTGKTNCCVVCGSKQDLNRHHVMPRVFRKHLPESIKDHNYHDVLLLCIGCHEQYELEATKFKQQIGEEFGFPVNNGSGIILSSETNNAIKSARALLHHGDKIPQTRKDFLLIAIKKYLEKEEISQEDLKLVTDQNPWQRSTNKEYGEYIIEKVDDLQKFTENWRQHFLAVMKPQFLPKHWDVSKPLVRDRIRTVGKKSSALSSSALKNIVDGPRINEVPC